jgi:hypothetical protein
MKKWKERMEGKEKRIQTLTVLRWVDGCMHGNPNCRPVLEGLRCIIEQIGPATDDE